MEDSSPDLARELANQAHDLDAQAARAGEESEAGRALLARAAQLRIEALGPKIYPVVACSSCSRITGWTDAAGRCDRCLRRAQLQAAFADPNGGFVSVADLRPPRKHRRPAARGLLGGLFARQATRDREAARAWLTLVDPDQNGPIAPEKGYEIEVARRDEIGAPDGSNTILIRFTTATSRFDGAAWERLERTRIPSSGILVPAELSAALPIEQLTEAWLDYGAAVHDFNRSVWERESVAREERRVAARERQDAIVDQKDIADLLREEG